MVEFGNSVSGFGRGGCSARIQRRGQKKFFIITCSERQRNDNNYYTIYNQQKCPCVEGGDEQIRQ